MGGPYTLRISLVRVFVKDEAKDGVSESELDDARSGPGLSLSTSNKKGNRLDMAK